MFTPIKLESNHKPEKPKPQSQAPPPSVQDNNELREKVIEEIFTTEHEYVNSLTVLREVDFLFSHSSFFVFSLYQFII
jgi:hypothetical protein